MNDLDGKKGTIFRYHNHENSFLNIIYQQLLEEQDIDVYQIKKNCFHLSKELQNPTQIYQACGKKTTIAW